MINILIPEARTKILSSNKTWVKMLEEKSKTKVSIDKEILVEGEDVDAVMRAAAVIKAFGRGFDFRTTMLLLEEGWTFETIDIRVFAGKSKSRCTSLKARVIGTGGTVKNKIQKYTNTKISIFGRTISIIGKWEDVEKARNAIEMLLSGSKHNTVYKFLGIA